MRDPGRRIKTAGRREAVACRMERLWFAFGYGAVVQLARPAPKRNATIGHRATGDKADAPPISVGNGAPSGPRGVPRRAPSAAARSCSFKRPIPYKRKNEAFVARESQYENFFAAPGNLSPASAMMTR